VILDDIRNHLAVMNVGQRERRTAVLLREAAAEIERLRLTDAERAAIRWAAKQMTYIRADNAAATLRGLLERTRNG
jgi:hypothetical protein